MPVIYSPLSDSELDSVCLSLVNQDLPYFSAFHEAFVLLYLTGCRVEEIFDIKRWERIAGYEMRFLPQKDNYHRNVTLDNRCDNFISAVVNQYKPFGGLSSGQLNSLFFNFSEYSNFRVGTKPVSLYLFRYNFVRRLFGDGLNINQIADKMGYTSITVVGGYLMAQIEKGFFLDTEGFVNINGTLWAQNYLDVPTDSGFSSLYYPFLDGSPLRYYNRLAIESFLAVNTSFRLPDWSDFYDLNSFISSEYGLYSSSLELPDSNYFNTVDSSMINLFSFGLKGSGFVLNGFLYNNRVRSYLMTSHSTSSMRGVYLPPAPSIFRSVLLSSSVILPVRLIYVI